MSAGVSTTRDNRARIGLLISSLGPGGAERTVANMANYWAERGRLVSVITLSHDDEDHYSLHQNVERHRVDYFWPSTNALRRVLDQPRRLSRLRRVLDASGVDVVISFVDKTNVRVLMASVGSKVPLIVSERSNPQRWPIGRAWSRLRRLFYKRAAAVAVQTQAVATWATDFVRDEKIVVIPNAVVVREAIAGERGRRVVALGRLSVEKGFDLLLQAWALLPSDLHDWQLQIVGSGPDTDELRNLAQQLGLTQRVQFVGLVDDPQPYLQGASLFVLSSRFEGFPNALLEAMASGTPAVSFDCENGPREIIEHGVNGMLVFAEDFEALSDVLAELLADPERLAQMGERAADVREQYGQAKVMQSWENLVERVVNAHA